MKHWWKPAGPAAFERDGWRVQKDWATGLWDIYKDDALKKQDFEGAPEAIEEAERMMDE